MKANFIAYHQYIMYNLTIRKQYRNLIVKLTASGESKMSVELVSICKLVDFLNENSGTVAQWDAVKEKIVQELNLGEQKFLMKNYRLDEIYTDLSMRMGEMGH